MITRRNQNSLSSPDRAEFVRALKALKNAPSHFNPPTVSRYDDFVYVHMQAMLLMEIVDRTKAVQNENLKITSDMRMPMWAHRCPAFFPWHRVLLYQLELELQKAASNPSLAIPYWDWSLDQSKTSAPWTDDFMGGDGKDGAVRSGPFAGAANWKITLSEDGLDHLVRGFGLATDDRTKKLIAPNLPTPSNVSACFQATVYDMAPWNDSSNLGSFRNEVEGWYVPPGNATPIGMHNLVHLWVGGNNGTMLPSTSPNDPVFFLHHANVDRLWAIWQARNPGVSPYLPASPLPKDPGQAWDEPMIFHDKSLSSTPPWAAPPATPQDVADHHKLGYTYDDEPRFTLAEEFKPQTTEAPKVDSLKQRPLKILPKEHFLKRLEELTSEQNPNEVKPQTPKRQK
jgi:tyrosinase